LSLAFGVGHIDRATSRSKFGNFAFAVFSVKFAAIALQERGVGQSLTIPGKPKLLAPFRTVPFFVTCGFFATAALRSSCGSDALGVGNNPDAVASVRCAKVGSWYAVPFRIIPERGQGSENVCKPSTKQSCDVFQDNVSGFQFANKTGDLVEKPAPLACEASALSCKADVLAGEPSGDDINGNSIGSEPFAGKGANIVINRNLRPPLGKDFAGVRLTLAERGGGEAAGALKAQRETAQARKQIQDAQLFHLPHSLLARGLTSGDLRHCVLQDEGVDGFAGRHAARPNTLEIVKPRSETNSSGSAMPC
jgi:hypothetical protein